MKWTELTIRTTTACSDLVAQILMEQGAAAGVAIYDRADINDGRNRTDWDYADEEELAADYAEWVQVRAYLPEDASLRERVLSVRHALDELASRSDPAFTGPLDIATDSLDEQDWANNWKQYYKPFAICPGVVICPSWETDYTAPAGSRMLVMDPGVAFGTGTHETTRMCARALAETLKPGQAVIDVGCGTGILSLVAASLGASDVLAIDIDENACRVTRENVRNNHCAVVRTVCADLLKTSGETADVVVANIIADAILYLSATIREHIRPGGTFIASGVINARADEVARALKSAGFADVERRVDGEWTAFVCR